MDGGGRDRTGAWAAYEAAAFPLGYPAVGKLVGCAGNAPATAHRAAVLQAAHGLYVTNNPYI